MKAQVLVEYLLLIAVISTIFWKVIGEVRDIFYGWDGQKGSIQLFIDKQVISKLQNEKW